MAANTPAEPNQAFMREVDDELRRDSAERFFKRHGIALIVGLVVLLVVVGGVLWWQHHRREQAGERSEALTAAMTDLAGGATREPLGRAALQKLSEAGGGYGMASRLALADAAAAKGDMKGAAAQFGAIAGDDDVAQPVRDLALVRQTVLEFDTIPTGTVRARLQGLAVAGQPWFGSAGEMVALSWLKDRQPGRAAPIFAALVKDPAVPETIRSRAVQMAGILGVETAAQGAPTAGRTGTR